MPDRRMTCRFRPYEKVLVRDHEDMRWCCALFSHRLDMEYGYFCVGCHSWKQCIPYEGNERLAGTYDKPEVC